MNFTSILQADKHIKILHCYTEKRTYMWQSEFEKGLSNDFTAYNLKEECVVYSKDIKLKNTFGKLCANFLENTKNFFDIEMENIPTTITYEHALSCFCNVVN